MPLQPVSPVMVGTRAEEVTHEFRVVVDHVNLAIDACFVQCETHQLAFRRVVFDEKDQCFVHLLAATVFRIQFARRLITM